MQKLRCDLFAAIAVCATMVWMDAVATAALAALAAATASALLLCQQPAWAAASWVAWLPARAPRPLVTHVRRGQAERAGVPLSRCAAPAAWPASVQMWRRCRALEPQQAWPALAAVRLPQSLPARWAGRWRAWRPCSLWCARAGATHAPRIWCQLACLLAQQPWLPALLVQVHAQGTLPCLEAWSLMRLRR